MKSWKLPFGILLAAALSSALLTGCSGTGGATTTEDSTEDAAFSYSKGIAENGYWEGITALDYVTLPDYLSIEVPGDITSITDEAIQEKTDSLLSSLATSTQVTDRAVVDGDTANIDFVGSVDGVEFEGGNTEGAGTEVTIGVSSYIDGFLEQLIGHTPGESFNIEVTFPDDYQETDLAGKDAVFAITINYISESTQPELTDALVEENFSANYGWTTVEGMKTGIAEDLKEEAVYGYIKNYIVDESTVSSIPQQILDYLDEAMVYYYEQSAATYSMSLEEFLSSYVGVDSVETLKERSAETNEESARYYLVVQAIAEDLKLETSDDDVKNYFTKSMNTDDISPYEEQYGMPYIKQTVLTQLLLDRLAENAKLA